MLLTAITDYLITLSSPISSHLIHNQYYAHVHVVIINETGVVAGLGLVGVVPGVEYTTDGKSFNKSSVIELADECQSVESIFTRLSITLSCLTYCKHAYGYVRWWVNE
jgi:hypothetical protein